MHSQLPDPAAYTPAMKAATRRLDKEKILFEVLTGYQIKVGDLNFYPGRGTIYRDGDHKALAKSGLDAFVDVARPRRRTDENLHYLEIKEQQVEDEDAGSPGLCWVAPQQVIGDRPVSSYRGGSLRRLPHTCRRALREVGELARFGHARPHICRLPA